MKCLITGCELLVRAEGKMLHGDLFAFRDGWVFNGVLEPFSDNAAWLYGSGNELLASGRHVLIVTGDYFERRGVVVVPQSCGLLNEAALTYVAKWS